MRWLLGMFMDVMQGAVFATLVVMAAILCTVIISPLLKIVGGLFGLS